MDGPYRKGKGNGPYRQGGFNVATGLNGFDDEGAYHSLEIREEDDVVGMDVGRIDIFTAARGNEPEDLSSCSKKEYYQRAGFDHRRKTTTRWIKNAPAIKDIESNMPTPETTSLDNFCQHLQYALQHMVQLVDFYGETRWKRLRWKTYIAKEKAWDVMVKRITWGNPRTIVALGDFCRPNTIGISKTPIKELRKGLKGRCRLRLIDEFRTSITCSKCDGELPKNTRFITDL